MNNNRNNMFLQIRGKQFSCLCVGYFSFIILKLLRSLFMENFEPLAGYISVFDSAIFIIGSDPQGDASSRINDWFI